MSNKSPYRSGYVALAGRPNVGKSTLLNHFVGQKVSIVTAKPQTTRQQILGIRTTANEQIIFIDTPGIHRQAKRAMNRYMNRAAASVLQDIHCVLMVVEALRWTDDDALVLERILQRDEKSGALPDVGLAVNKIDKIKQRDALLPWLQDMAKKHDFHFIVPVSATRGENMDALATEIRQCLPESEAFYPDDVTTDQSERFFVAEVIREKLMTRLHQELPYSIAVTVDDYKDEDTLLRIAATIWVERESQKAIVIGKKGAVLKAIGQAARIDLEKRFKDKVFLQLWVKIRDGWSDDERALQNLGLTDAGKGVE